MPELDPAVPDPSHASGGVLDGLPLRQPTPAAWITTALADVDALLRDHAYCEKKAASASLTLITKCPDDPVLVRSMTALAHEELRHFSQVHRMIRARGGALGSPEPDRYVRRLRKLAFQRPGGLGAVADLLLVNGLIEARSCERMRLLVVGLDGGAAELAPDERRDLLDLYRGFALAEARHWETFRDLASRLRPVREVDRRLGELADVEAEIVRSLPLEPRMH